MPDEPAGAKASPARLTLAEPVGGGGNGLVESLQALLSPPCLAWLTCLKWPSRWSFVPALDLPRTDGWMLRKVPEPRSRP